MTFNLLHVAAGGAIGSVLRYLIIYFVPSVSFPLGTLAVNVTGSFLIGAAYTCLQNRLPDDSLQLFLVVGILGGFTTFSTFSLEMLNFLQDGNYVKAFLYIGLTVILCLFACFTGMDVAKSL